MTARKLHRSPLVHVLRSQCHSSAGAQTPVSACLRGELNGITIRPICAGENFVPQKCMGGAPGGGGKDTPAICIGGTQPAFAPGRELILNNS